MMTKDIHIPFISIRIGRFLFLLISMVLYFALRPFFEDFFRLSFLVTIFMTAILVTAVYAVSVTKTNYIVTLVIVILVTIMRWMRTAFGLESLGLAVNIFDTGFFIFTFAVILSYIFKKKEVTSDVIMGSICAYFLLGLIWAEFYAFLEIIQPGCFNMPQAPKEEASSFIYFSFVTLTTLGYGDIIPLTNKARSFVYLEAIFGQLYLAILIARLVGTHIAQSGTRDSKKEED